MSWRMRRKWIRLNSAARIWAIPAGSAFSTLPRRLRGGSRRGRASRLSDAEIVTGRGIAVGTHHVSYGAAVAEIEVNKRTGNIVAKHLYGALDCGLTVNPALVENQIIGMMVQATSRMLKEEVTFDQNGVTSLDWVSYPVLRFAEHPNCTAVVIQRINEPSSGAGEEVMGAAGAAIANAFFDATGVRLRQYPLTPKRVRAALAAGKTGAAEDFHSPA